VNGWQKLVPVAEMILIELRRVIPLGFEDFGEGGIFLLKAPRGPRNADGGLAGANGELPMMKAARPAVQLGWP
jgi:hypothetical protein